MAQRSTSARIQEIVEQVLARLGGAGGRRRRAPRASARRPRRRAGASDSREHPARHAAASSPIVDSAAKAARAAFEAERAHAARDAQQDDRGDARDDARARARAVAATRSRRPASAASRTSSRRTRSSPSKTPGTEILRPIAYTGDDGLTLTERAPYGVIRRDHADARTRPRPSSTTRIGMVAGGNAVVFNVHPSAAQRRAPGACTCSTRRSPAAGGPREPARAASSEPTIESAQALMKHPGVRLARRHRRPRRGARRR